MRLENKLIIFFNSLVDFWTLVSGQYILIMNCILIWYNVYIGRYIGMCGIILLYGIIWPICVYDLSWKKKRKLFSMSHFLLRSELGVWKSHHALFAYCIIALLSNTIIIWTLSVISNWRTYVKWQINANILCSTELSDALL